MRSAKSITSAALLAALCVFVFTGCETTRVNKLHSAFDSVSDITTTPHPDLKYASVSTGIPPVPGSPTGAGADGTQPWHDSQARKSPGSEKGKPTPPREQVRDSFIRQ